MIDMIGLLWYIYFKAGKVRQTDRKNVKINKYTLIVTVYHLILHLISGSSVQRK